MASTKTSHSSSGIILEIMSTTRISNHNHPSLFGLSITKNSVGGGGGVKNIYHAAMVVSTFSTTTIDTDGRCTGYLEVPPCLWLKWPPFIDALRNYAG